MEKKFHIARVDHIKFKTYEDAEKEAKRYTSVNDDEYAVLVAVAVTKVPTPDIEVTKI